MEAEYADNNKVEESYQKPMLDINASVLSSIHQMFRDAQDRLLRKIDCTVKDLKKDLTELRNSVATPKAETSQVMCNQMNDDDCKTAVKDKCPTDDPTDCPVRFLRRISADFQLSADCNTKYLRLSSVAVQNSRLRTGPRISRRNIVSSEIYINVNERQYSAKKCEDHPKAKWKLEMEPIHEMPVRVSLMFVDKSIPFLKKLFISFPS